MKTFITSLFSLLILTNLLTAQQQIQNPGFELWEDAGTVEDEPVNWSSIKTSDDVFYNNLAPIVWGKSDDAHSGDYSLSLFNVGSLVIATGTVSNGRYHTQLPADSSYVYTDLDDEQWHSSFTDRPDSVVGWFKCNPTDGDFGTVKFVLHTGYFQIPGDESNMVAEAYLELPTFEVDEWSRFSAPFEYFSSNNPEYYLSILTSGNGTEAKIGSTALFDDLEFIYNEDAIDEIHENLFSVIVKNQEINILINDNSQQLYELRLIDINGRTVLHSQITSGSNVTVNIGDLPLGLYIATANNSRKAYTKKVIIN